jgi:Sec-independent protein translocase protein TatA
MDLFNFGREQLQKGMLNNMLEEVGIDDVGSFVQEFRSEANREAANTAQQHGDDEEYDEDEDTSVRNASSQQANLFSKGSSFLNQVFK